MPRESRREIERSQNAGAPSFIDEYCADDVVGIAPGQPPAGGKDAGKKMMDEMFDAPDPDVEVASEEIVVGKELAVDRLTAQEPRIPKDGGEPSEHTAGVVYICRRSPDGDWKRSHTMGTDRE